MPICPFFVSGKCTYADKCFNQHVNVGQVVQVTSKGTLAGKQWLLSCFAPFEGEIILPNYIEDQSFEEVRAEWYAARASNTQHLAQQKFNQAWTAAQEMTMKMVNMDQSVQAYLVNTFGVNAKRKPATTATSPAAQSNPFASALATSPTSNNIFGQAQANPFGAAAPTTTPQFGNSIFGGTQHPQQTPPGGNIFGGGGRAIQSQNSGNIFGQSSMAQQPQQQQQQPSIFGGTSPQVAGGQSIFGQQTPTATTGGNIFGQTVATAAPTGNIFGLSQQPVAVQANVFQQQQQPHAIPAFGGPAQSIFHANQQQQPPLASNNLFGQPAAAPQQPQSAPPNPFQQQSPFPQQTIAPTLTSGGNVFGNVAQNAMQAAESSVFGQTHSQNQLPREPAPPQQILHPTSNQGNRNAFGGQSQNQNSGAPLNSLNVYSKIENLKPEQLQAFQAQDFELGSIPNCPPPRELCF